MTEYWVSQAKYYCKFCKQWMADNKVSRKNHEASERHKNQVEYFHKKKRDEKLHGARSEQELTRQLAAINKAAQDAVAQDRAQMQGNFYQSNHQFPVTAPPPPPIPLAPSAGQNSSVGHNAMHQAYARPVQGNVETESLASRRARSLPSLGPLSEKAVDMISENLRDKEGSSGVYTVRGVTYLEGQYFEDRLVGDTECEIFVEEEDDWCAGKIIRCRNVAVPNTEVVQKTFDVEYVSTSSDCALGMKTESGVKSDRIRLIQRAPVAPVTVEESTGLGKWQTVAVREVNEEEERKKQQQREKEAEKQRAKAMKASLEEDARALAEAGEGDDALSSYDPYNTGVYRGIAVDSRGDAEGQAPKTVEIESLCDGKEVGFKKRKTTSGGGRRIRRKDSTD
mmetsp:Transcript_26612/g.39541  ORF Transcript_26612/g.39541 Transcript_26612/m.39541 type:complete len:395 (+) Transcript_26612:60-1244(+)